MQVDEATEGRRLRKRKEKTPKKLKREANEKEMDACHCGAEYETEYSESIDTHTISSTDSNESPTTDERYPTSLDGKQPVDHLTSTDQCYLDFAFQQPNNGERDDYSIGSRADIGFHESFAIKTIIPDPNENPTEEYDEDYWKEKLLRSLCMMTDIHAIPSTTRLHHRSTNSSQHRDSDGHARAMDGRILQVSREDITDILQVAKWTRQLVYAATQHSRQQSSCSRHKSKGQHNRNWFTPIMQTCWPPSLDRKVQRELKDEYGVYIYESGYARSVAGEMIPVTEDNIRKILERASLFEESHICLPEHATSFTPTRPAPEIYTKDEINEMVTGIFGDQEELGDELKTLVDDTYQPLDRGYNELFRSMAEIRTEIESMQHNLEKEATTSPSIDANKTTSIDVKPQTSQIPAEPKSLAEKKDEWEVAYINTRINDVYNPLNNNVDWLSTRIDLLQQELDTIRMADPQPATLIDIYNITSIDTRFAAMEDRLKSYEHMHDRFTSPIMRYLDTLSTQIMNVQRDIAAAVDQITSKLYTAIDNMEERFEKRCDDIYFPFDVKLSGLDSQAECTTPATIDRHLVASIDTTSTPDDEQLIQNKMESMQEQLNELSAYAYSKIGWHQSSIKDIQETLQNISNAIQKMEERWTRNDETTRSFIAAWSRMCRDEVDACFPTSSCLSTNKPHTSKVKLNDYNKALSGRQPTIRQF
ncbi:hypothetical protein F2Q69_00013329 [Brassica cretica]|uniref:Uncharacterized protein n=1 Tax=Brassica cretica TaxID=69181 RepID=A0A8S9QS29_BRACR|nr:hypothetical protein F2Q69_00013329 [Brassica cretica]